MRAALARAHCEKRRTYHVRTYLRSLVPSWKRVRKIRLVNFINILGLHLLFIVYRTCTCVIPRCCLITRIVRSNDLQLHHYFSVINCAVMTSHCCLICGKKALPLSRRIIDPPSPGIHGVRDFFVRFVKPGFVFPALASGNRCQYWKSLCRSAALEVLGQHRELSISVCHSQVVPDDITLLTKRKLNSLQFHWQSEIPS